jgi:hypothetical protein
LRNNQEKKGTISSLSKRRLSWRRKSWENMEKFLFWALPVEVRLPSYEFCLPLGSYIEICTNVYVFSGPRWLAGWIGYWIPIKLPHRLSASCHWTPPPPHH